MEMKYPRLMENYNKVFKILNSNITRHLRNLKRKKREREERKKKKRNKEEIH